MNTTNENFDFEELQKFFKAISFFGGTENDGGTEEDTMPEGYGEFGLEITNPIPVNSILGNKLYLDRLWTDNGVKITYERIGSMRAPNISSIIDGYRIYARGEKIATLYICPYNKKISERAPEGFILM